MNPSQSAISQSDWDFHSFRGDTDPEDIRFRPRCVGVADVWKEFLSGDRTLSFPGDAGSMNLSQSGISQ